MKKLKLKKITEGQKIKEFLQLTSKLIFKKNQPLYSPDLEEENIGNKPENPWTISFPIK